METPPNPPIPKSTGEHAHELAWKTHHLRSALNVYAQPYEQLGSALRATGLVSTGIAEQMSSALDVYARPYEQLGSALRATGMVSTGIAEQVHFAFDASAQMSEHIRSVFDASSQNAEQWRSFLGASARNAEQWRTALDASAQNAEQWRSTLSMYGTGTNVQNTMGELLAASSASAGLANSVATILNSPSTISGLRSSMDLVSGTSALGGDFHKLQLGLVYTPVAPFDFHTPLVAIDEQLVEVKLILRKSGYFFWHCLPLRVLNRIKRFVYADEPERNAFVTNELLSFTKTEEFAKELEEDFLNSPILSLRWQNIKDVLEVHQRGKYSLTVRNLLAEIEGIIGDLLAAEGKVILENGKIYRVSEPKHELKSLAQIASVAQHSQLQEYEEFRKFRKYVAKNLSPESNPTRHGRVIDYYTADLSAKLFLNVHGLAATISDHFT